MGDPINTPLIKSFYKASDFQAAGLSTAIVAAVYDHLAEQEALFLTAGVVYSSIMDIAFFRFMEKYLLGAGFSFSKDQIKTKCIDTRPDGSTIQSLDKYGSLVSEAKTSYALSLGLWSAMEATYIANEFAAGAPDRAIGRVFGNAAAYTRLIGGYQRFNKLSKGDWVIVDMPKPKPVEAKTPAYQSTAMPA